MSINLASTASSFLNDLKTQTAVSHKKLEDLPVSMSIMSPDMKIDEYAKYLNLMRDVHQDTEETIFPLFRDLIQDLEQRRKKQLIEADLAFINHDVKTFEKVFKTEKISLPFALGILYVVEGSTLGGRFILKNVSKLPQLSGDQGVSYFNGYGERTGSFWKSFLNFLADFEQKEDCGEEITSGAIFAFDSIYNHFAGK